MNKWQLVSKKEDKGKFTGGVLREPMTIEEISCPLSNAKAVIALFLARKIWIFFGN